MATTYDEASLVLIPSGTKTSKVFSQKPVNGDGDFTFTRSTAATRVNADGNIEKETQNLLLQSNTFDTTWNTSTPATITGGQADKDGGTNAWKLEAVTASTAYTRQFINTSSSVATFSFYAKAGTADWTYVNCVNITAFFDLANGAIGYVGGGANVIDKSITSVGGGWYRVSLTGTGMTQQRIYTAPANNNSVSAVGDNIYIQDAQLEYGLVARDYIETTTAAVEKGITDNVPRLDYTDASCPSLLLEPQRTNALANSEYFGSNWTLGGIGAIDTNSTNSPEGIQNATKFKASSTSSTHSQIENVGGGQKTFSIFAKEGEESEIMIYGRTAVGEGVMFDLSDGSFIKYWNNNSDHIDSYSSTDYGNGWYRYEINFDAATDIRIFIGKNGAITFPQTSGNGIYIYGAQFEDASYATSYIPTYGSSVTRNRDSATNSVTNTTSRTYFLEGKRLADDGFQTSSGFYDPNDNLLITYWNSNRLRFRFGGAINKYHTLTGDDFKIAVSYDGTDSRVFVNGQLAFTQTFTLGNVTSIILTGNNGAVSYNQTLLFPTALTDQEAIDLTTL